MENKSTSWLSNVSPFLRHLRVYPENSFRISLGIPELVYKKGFFSPVGGWGAQDHPETFGIDAYAYWAKDTSCCDSPNSSWRRRRVQSRRESRKYSSKYPPFQLRSRGSVQVGQVEKSGKITKMLKNHKKIKSFTLTPTVPLTFFRGVLAHSEVFYLIENIYRLTSKQLDTIQSSFFSHLKCGRS